MQLTTSMRECIGKQVQIEFLMSQAVAKKIYFSSSIDLLLKEKIPEVVFLTHVFHRKPFVPVNFSLEDMYSTQCRIVHEANWLFPVKSVP